jgi:hypothetical protein
MASSTQRRQYLPLVYVVFALGIGGLLLPSALRPPPNPAQTSNALDPNAPPDHNPNQILESLQQAGGGGAGAGVGGTKPAPTPTPSASGVIASPTPSTPSLQYCYGTPPRQIPSIYAAECKGAWHGDNGGATAFNVFPNEVRIGIQNAGLPAGRLPDPSTNDASTGSGTQTFQALQQYFNAHYQLYGRRIVFYGAPDPAETTADSYAANAKTLAQTDHLFLLSEVRVGVCEDAANNHIIVFCDSTYHENYVKHDPYLYTYNVMEYEDVLRFMSEFVCSSLVGKKAEYAGVPVSSRPRKLGILAYQGLEGGIPGSRFEQALMKQCHVASESATLNGLQDTQGATAAMAKFEADGVTTVILNPGDVNTLLAMTAAGKSGYYPEWIQLGTDSLDVAGIAQLLPTEESAHLFGISGLEWPQHFANTECVRAVQSIYPNLRPSESVCTFWWTQLVWMLNGIQEAGPHLTPVSFRQGLYDVGYKFNQTPWMMGGGYGPGVYSFPHSVSLIWFNPAVLDPTTGNPGAYEYLFNGRKFQLGQLPTKTDQFFRSGSVVAPDSCKPSKPPC